jgi:hypothetical protein
MNTTRPPLRLAVLLNAMLVAFCLLLLLGEAAWQMFGSWLYVPLLLGCIAFSGSAFVARSPHPTRHLLLAVIVGNIPFLCVAAYAVFRDLQALKFVGPNWPLIVVAAALFFTALFNITVSRSRLKVHG